jgi:hypothetical protein
MKGASGQAVAFIVVVSTGRLVGSLNQRRIESELLLRERLMNTTAP